MKRTEAKVRRLTAAASPSRLCLPDTDGATSAEEEDDEEEDEEDEDEEAARQRRACPLRAGRSLLLGSSIGRPAGAASAPGSRGDQAHHMGG